MKLLVCFILIIVLNDASLMMLRESMPETQRSRFTKTEHTLHQNTLPLSSNLPCQLLCKYWPIGHDFVCSNVKCPNITRKVMTEARTTNPKYPFLRNTSSLPKLKISIDGWDIRYFQNGFLSDYPTLDEFEIQYTSVTKLSRGMFVRILQLKSLRIMDCPSLSIIEDGIFPFSVNTLNLLRHNKLRMVSENLFRCVLASL